MTNSETKKFLTEFSALLKKYNVTLKTETNVDIVANSENTSIKIGRYVDTYCVDHVIYNL